MNTKLQKSFRKSDKKKENKVTLLSGELGIPLNGQRLVEVPNRQGFVFVRLKNNTSELIQAYNAVVSPIYDLPVLVARQVGGYKIVGRNIDRYTNQWGNAPFLPKHGAQHSFNPDINIGGDIVWVYSQQMMPLLAYPSGSSGSPRLTVAPYIIRDMNGAWKYVGNTGTPDTTPYNPTTGSRAVIGLVYLDTVSGNPQLLINSGTYIDASLTGTNQIVDYIPRSSNPNWIPLAGIRLVSGSTQLSWNNVYDVRPFLQVVPTGSSSGGGGGGGGGGIGIVGWDEGIYQATGTILNVTGQRGTLTASGTVLNLVFSPDPVELIGVYGLSNGTPLGTGTWIDFGNNLTASISGTVIRVDATSSGGGGTGTITIQDEGITQGNVSTLNFVGDNVTATVSGIIGTISITGSAGGSGAPTDAYYVVANTGTSSLNNAINVPGYRALTDKIGVGGGGTLAPDHEFSDDSAPFSWTPSSPDTADYNTTVLSHLYIKSTDNTTRHALENFAPTGTFDQRMKITMGCDNTPSNNAFGLAVADSGNTNGCLLQILATTSGYQLKAYTYAGSVYTQRGSTVTFVNTVYMRITRDNSNNCSYYYSLDGILWTLIATQANTFTAAQRGIRVAPNGNVTIYAAIDWIRGTP